MEPDKHCQVQTPPYLPSHEIYQGRGGVEVSRDQPPKHVLRHAWVEIPDRAATELCLVCDLLVPFCGPDACLAAPRNQYSAWSALFVVQKCLTESEPPPPSLLLCPRLFFPPPQTSPRLRAPKTFAEPEVECPADLGPKV